METISIVLPRPHAVFDIAQSVAIFVTLVALVIQIRKNTSALQFDIHERLNDQYTEILWRAVQDPTLNEVWIALPEDHKRNLDSAQNAGRWGAWFALKDDEKKMYRYIRVAFELFEQAYVARQDKWIPKNLWGKWHDAMRIWKKTRFFDYVIADTRPRFTKKFLDYIDGID